MAAKGARAKSSSAYARIYAVVRAIPPGRVATYGQVAALAGLGGRARQVGYALHALPDTLLEDSDPAAASAGIERPADLPWQRVINARGEVSRRAEPGREGFQRFLLEEEGVVFDLAGRLDLERFLWQPGELPRRPGRPQGGGRGRPPGARRR